MSSIYPLKRLVSAMRRQLYRIRTRRAYDAHHSPTFKPYQVKRAPGLKKKRKKVLHAIANFVTGGSARLVVDLIENLSDEFEQEVITAYNPHPPAYVGIKIKEYPPLPGYDTILRHLRTHRPDLVHVHYWGGGDFDWYELVFRAAEELRIPVIENVNTPVTPYINRNIRHYVYVSDYVRKEFGPDETRGRSSVIYPGSDFTLFRRRSNPAPPDDCIGMVYRLEPDKLNAEAIDVFIKVIERRKGTKALIVGGGRFLGVYQEAVRRAGVADAFEFTGYVSYEQLPNYYERMSVFVAPVHKESFGQVSPFAMSMEIPVVGYEVGALPEIIGCADLLAPPGDSDRLASIIIELLDDRARRLALGKANRARAHALFSVEAMACRYRELYRQVLLGHEPEDIASFA